MTPGFFFYGENLLLVYLHVILHVHPKDSSNNSTKAHDEAANLHEEAHLDDLVPHAVQVGRDELVSVLDHVDHDFDLVGNRVEIR